MRDLRRVVWLFGLGAALVMSAALSSSCTKIPKPISTPTASFDGGVQNSGYIGFYTNATGETWMVITPRKRETYNALIPKYGKEFARPLTVPDEGLTPFTNGTSLLDLEHVVKLNMMLRWKRQRGE